MGDRYEVTSYVHDSPVTRQLKFLPSNARTGQRPSRIRHEEDRDPEARTRIIGKDVVDNRLCCRGDRMTNPHVETKSLNHTYNASYVRFPLDKKLRVIAVGC